MTALELYPFQKVGVRFLNIAGSALMADDMGVGKTVQAITAIEESESYPALIVCPNTVKSVWAREFGRWAPHRKISVAESGSVAAHKAAQKIVDGVAEVLIINWDALRSMSRLAGFGSNRLHGCVVCDPILAKQAEIWDQLSKEERIGSKRIRPGNPNRCERCNKVLNDIPWKIVVADEAHRAKSPDAKQTRALWAVGDKAGRRLALTGTPISNSPEDLWSVMRFVAPDEWPVKWAWIDRYAVMVPNYYSNSRDVVGLREDRREELDRFLLPRFIRRTKAQVLPDLPPKTYERREVQLTAKQKKAYDSLKKDMLAGVDGGHLVTTSVLTQALRLRQLANAYGELITSTEELTFDDMDRSDFDKLDESLILSEPSSKLDALEEVLEELGDQQVVVFADSRQLIDLAHARLAEKYSCAMLTGPIATKERATGVENFRKGLAQIMLATTGAGGEGVDGLQAAHVAVFLQRPWSQVMNRQAEDRLHRIGQTENVLYIDLVAVDTVEERVFESLIEKGERLEDLVRDKEALIRWLQ